MRGDRRQIPLPLEMPAAMTRAAFCAGPANATALALVEAEARWPEARLALAGPPRSGKSHLVAIWQDAGAAAVVSAADLVPERVPELAGAGRVAVEDVHRIAAAPDPAKAEAALFHLHNLLGSSGGQLLVTGRSVPSRWPVRLPDLASRLQAMTPAVIAEPDDGLLSALLARHLAARQITAGEGLVAFLLRRIERSFAAAEAVVATLDARSLGEKRRVTWRLADEILAGEGLATGLGLVGARDDDER